MTVANHYITHAPATVNRNADQPGQPPQFPDLTRFGNSRHPSPTFPDLSAFGNSRQGRRRRAALDADASAHRRFQARDQRQEVRGLRTQGRILRDMARIVGYHFSTVSRIIAGLIRSCLPFPHPAPRVDGELIRATPISDGSPAKEDATNDHVFLESCGCGSRLEAADEAHAVAALLSSFQSPSSPIPMCRATRAVMESAGAIPGRLYGVPDRYLGDVLLALSAGYAAVRFAGKPQWFRLVELDDVHRRWEALP